MRVDALPARMGRLRIASQSREEHMDRVGHDGCGPMPPERRRPAISGADGRAAGRETCRQEITRAPHPGWRFAGAVVVGGRVMNRIALSTLKRQRRPAGGVVHLSPGKPCKGPRLHHKASRRGWPWQCIARLGARMLSKFFLEQSAHRNFRGAGLACGLQRKDLWRGAVGGAIAAELLAQRPDCTDPARAYTRGRLRDAGKPVIAPKRAPMTPSSIRRECSRPGRSPHDAHGT